MTSTERMEKVVSAMSKLPSDMALLVPFRIAHRCIVAAKTNEAKTRLVQTANWICIADTKNIWKKQIENFMKKF